MILFEISETTAVLLIAIALYAVFGLAESLLTRLEARKNRRKENHK